MKKTLTTALLGLYFFSYTIPQYIPGLFYVYDRVTIQTLFISVLNLISFIIIIRTSSFHNLLSFLKSKYHYYAYGGFILASIISLAFAENGIEGVITLTKFIVFFISFTCIAFIGYQSKISFLKVLIAFSFLSVFIESLFINYLYYESVITNGQFLQRGNDFNGFGANINISSFSLVLKIPVILYIFFNSTKRGIKVISMILLFSSFLTILLLQSRAAILALFLILLFVFLISIIQKQWLYVRNLIVVSLMGVFSLIAYQQFNDKNTSDVLVERFSTITDPGSDDSVKERLNFYSTAIESISMNPLFGIGVGNWKIVSIKYSKDIIKEYRVPYFAHNDFLQVTAEIGVIGGMLYMFFILYPFFMSAFYTLKNKIFDQYFLVFLILGGYIIDSMLNFPMDRPMMVIFLFFTFSLFYDLEKNKIINHEK